MSTLELDIGGLINLPEGWRRYQTKDNTTVLSCREYTLILGRGTNKVELRASVMRTDELLPTYEEVSQLIPRLFHTPIVVGRVGSSSDFYSQLTIIPSQENDWKCAMFTGGPNWVDPQDNECPTGRYALTVSIRICLAPEPDPPVQPGTRGQHWDQYFWSELEEIGLKQVEVQEWLVSIGSEAEERTVFEVEVEAMLQSCIPTDIHSLQQAYGRCDWSAPLSNATADDLRSAIAAVSYLEELLDIDDLKAQLTPMGMITANGQVTSRPPPTLTFPEEHLIVFLHELKYYTLLTMWRFIREYTCSLHSLPSTVWQTLQGLLFEIVWAELLRQLWDSSEPA